MRVSGISSDAAKPAAHPLARSRRPVARLLGTSALLHFPSPKRNRLAGRGLLGWFPHTPREWIEFIIIALLLWLLMVVVITELELNSVTPI